MTLIGALRTSKDSDLPGLVFWSDSMRSNGFFPDGDGVIPVKGHFQKIFRTANGNLMLGSGSSRYIDEIAKIALYDWHNSVLDSPQRALDVARQVSGLAEATRKNGEHCTMIIGGPDGENTLGAYCVDSAGTFFATYGVPSGSSSDNSRMVRTCLRHKKYLFAGSGTSAARSYLENKLSPPNHLPMDPSDGSPIPYDHFLSGNGTLEPPVGDLIDGLTTAYELAKNVALGARNGVDDVFQFGIVTSDRTVVIFDPRIHLELELIPDGYDSDLMGGVFQVLHEHLSECSIARREHWEAEHNYASSQLHLELLLARQNHESARERVAAGISALIEGDEKVLLDYASSTPILISP